MERDPVADPLLGLVGRVIGGNYRVERLLGKGGMGAVFLARQLTLDRNVAIKVLLSPLAMDREMLERFQREARAASNIGHPGIVQVIDLGHLEEGPPFIAMEMLEGEDLRSKLLREGALSPAQAVPIALQVCDALQAAHDKGIVHRDLKPDNIFLVYRPGRPPTVKLLDFGLSKIKGSDRKLTNTGALLGTPNYMSPEQVKGDRAVDHRTDIYAAGAILYEMMTGRNAYDGPSVQSILVSIMTESPPPPRRIRPDLPEVIEAVILRALARSPEERYQAMNELGYELARAGSMAGVPVSQLGIYLPSSGPPAPPPTLQAPQQVATAPLTPPPVSMPASSVSRPGGAGKLVLAAVLVLVLVLVVAVVAGGAAFVAVMLGTRKPADEEKAVAVESIIESAAEEEAGSTSATPPAAPLATGTNPHLCCSKKGCGLVLEQEGDEGNVIQLVGLDRDLERTFGPVALSPADGARKWPTCFARDDGGYLVLSQETRDPFDMSGTVTLHRVVVSKDGKPAEGRTSTIRNMVSIDEFAPTYAAAAASGKVVVIWDHYQGVESGIRLSILDMDGKEDGSGASVHSLPTVHSSTLACGSERCLVAWTRPSLPMNHIRKLAVITTSGSVVEADRTIWDRGILVSEEIIVPLGSGAAVLWVEETSSGKPSQMIAIYDWNAKEILSPTRLDELGSDFSHDGHPGYASSDGSTIAVTRPVPTGPDETLGALTLMIDPKGKVKSKGTFSVPDEEIEDAWVFPGPDGKPVILYTHDSWGSDQGLFLARYEPK